MTVGNWKTTGKEEVGSKEIEECHKVCYLGGTITNDGGCAREILIRLGKVNSTFGENLGEPEDIDPCKGPAVQLTSPGSVSLWSRDWPMSKSTTRKLEAAHDS